MSWWKELKTLFPKPIFPQKRYMLLFAVMLYYASKLWVAYTPSTADDNLPEEVRAIVLQILADKETDNSPVVVVGDKAEFEQTFGERD